MTREDVIEQFDLLPIDNRSMQSSRLRRRSRMEPPSAERVFAAEWIRVNKMRWGSSQRTLIELILCRDGERPRTVSRRDAAVAASVIQWLATPIGSSFVQQCEKKYNAAMARYESDRPRRARVAMVQDRLKFAAMRRMDDE